MIVHFLFLWVAQAWALPNALDHTRFPRSLTNGTPLNIVCIGDSITAGVGSDDNNGPDGRQNGYRLDLYKSLTYAGLNPRFIGTQVSGTNDPQPDEEGYGGYTSSAILDQISRDDILSQGPNLVLLHAGTNDMAFGNDGSDTSNNWASAPARLGALIDYILCRDPTAVVLVAEIIADKFKQDQTDIFNSHVPEVVQERYMKNYKVRVVDMTMIKGDLLYDLLHPTPDGYAIMAQQWYNAIMNVPDSWWVPQS